MNLEETQALPEQDDATIEAQNEFQTDDPAIAEVEAAEAAEESESLSYRNEVIAHAESGVEEAPTEQERVRWQPTPRKKRFGDRKDGRRLRSLAPISYVSPFIMDYRNGSSNFISDRIDIEPIERYLREKKQQGHIMTLMHVLIAGYVRTVAAFPGINRFCSGQRIYARNDIQVMLTIKKEMTLQSPDTVLKAHFRPDDNIYDVYAEFDRLITSYRKDPGGDFDRTAALLTKIPRILLRGAIKLLRFLDYFGHLPKALLEVSPFHGSFFITSMGSLGIPPIYHHLYDFGNVPVFMSFGAKQRRNVILDDGTVKKEHYVDFTVVTDERICDGYYFATALKYLKKILKNPWVLDEAPAEVVEDVD